MLQSAILTVLTIILVPLCAIVVLRCIAKTKRERRPVHHFRLR